MLGGWYIANFVNDNTDFEYMTAGPPIGPGGKTSKLEISGYAISADTPNRDAAWEFIKFIASPAGQKIWSVVGTPTRRSSLDTFLAESPTAEWFRPFVEVLSSAQHTPFFANSAEINQILGDGQAPIFLGQASAEEAAAVMAADMRAVVGS
jgi:multiple sugar transport system substrate-binding protein